jgi:hypothetical protein
MFYINNFESRPFSYLDFGDFEVGGKKYSISHGTFRNKISRFTKNGVVELYYNSRIAFYKLKGFTFGHENAMTGNHMGISSVTNVTNVIPYTADIGANNFLIQNTMYLNTLNTNANSIHDIHTKFTVPDIYKITSSYPKYNKLINPVSKDIPLDAQTIDDMIIRTTIHRTDTVTVIIGCSRCPITLDEKGITRLSCALTRIEERLSRKIDDCGALLEGGCERIPIPDNRRWQVTLWHFGKDKFQNEYPSNGYALTWGHGGEVLRVYLKTLDCNRIERNEVQECPNKSLAYLLDKNTKPGGAGT